MVSSQEIIMSKKVYKSKKPNLRKEMDLMPDPDQYTHIGKFLGDVRQFLKRTKGEAFTQKNIAEKCGYTCAQYISNFERCLHLPSLKTTVFLTELYGLDKNQVYKMFLRHREETIRNAFWQKRPKKNSERVRV